MSESLAGSVADLSITKTDGSSTATPGLEISYTIVATNAGPSTVSGATVTDAFPAPLIGCRWTCAVSGTGSCGDSGTGDLGDAVSLAAGASATYTAICVIPSTAGGTLSNTATIAAPSGVADPDPANNSATDIDTLTPQAYLSVTKTDSAINVSAGGTTTYSIVASNAGPSDAPGVIVSDIFPPTLNCTWTCRAGPRSSCTAAGSGNIVDTADIGVFVEYTATCAIAPTATGTLANTATIAAPPDVIDVTPADNSATDIDQIVGAPPSSNAPVPALGGVALATFAALLIFVVRRRMRPVR